VEAEPVNAINPVELGAAAGGAGLDDSLPVQRARLCHFFELALAHPGEEGYDYFCKEETEQDFLAAYAEALRGDAAALTAGQLAARSFFARLRGSSYEDVESAHISLFSANWPRLPCPPYGSLFTAADADKRLEEMLAIKQFYHQHGVDIADTFTDLPDHLCVELEFLQLLDFRENEAEAAGDAEVLEGLRAAQREFLDRFLMPLATSLADLAAGSMPDNPYADLLEVMRCFVAQHRKDLGAGPATSSSA
jgi:TorA maturation chaperone TorD